MSRKQDIELGTLGWRIHTQRTESGMTQDDLAVLVNVDRKKIGAWEQNKSAPDIASLQKLCELFNCESGYLLGDHEMKTRQQTDIYLETGLSADAVYSLLSLNDIEKSFVDALLSSRPDLYFIAAAFEDFKYKQSLNNAVELGKISDEISDDALMIQNSLDYARFTLLNRFQLFAEGNAKK